MIPEYEWRTGRSCVFKNYVHLIFVTKYRRGVFTAPILARLKEVFAETMEQMDGELLDFGGEDDHVHLLVACHPKVAISNLVGKLKGKSSYFLRQEFWPQIRKKVWGDHFWSPSYCVVSCGGAALDVVRQYVVDQRSPPAEKHVAQSKRFRGKTRNADKTWVNSQ